MQHDQVIWQVLDDTFCSFKVKTKTQKFCRNENNVTGLCSQESCPLANSQYATLREIKGDCFLFMKTIERAHSPAKLWEKILLSRNYAEALKQIDENLLYWSNVSIHRCKQRLTKITQYLIRMRKLKLSSRPKLIPIKKKEDRRDAQREMKAEKAAKLEVSIEKELLQRLKEGAYGSMYDGILNANKEAFDSLLNQVEEENEEEYVEGETEDEMEDFEAFGDQFDFMNTDDEEMEEETGGPKIKKQKTHVEIEYEQENEPLENL